MKKKNILFILLIVAILMFAPSVLAQNVVGQCADTLDGVKLDVKLVNIVHMIILVIKIAVPILLVIFGMLDLMKGITSQKEEEIKKGQQILVKRLIAGVLVFFVISIVQLLISLVADKTDEDKSIWPCAKCFMYGADENGVCKGGTE